MDDGGGGGRGGGGGGFQAEDGIRGYDVTGVQTCALPIWFPADFSGVLRRSVHSRIVGVAHSGTRGEVARLDVACSVTPATVSEPPLTAYPSSGSEFSPECGLTC